MTSRDEQPGRGGDHAAPAAVGADPGRRSTLALVSAATLVVVAVALVLLFGLARPPELAGLGAEPVLTPPASVAWQEFGDEGSCLFVARPGGGTSEIRCDVEGGELWGWDDDGILLLSFGVREQLLVLDPSSGEVIEQRPVEDATGREPVPMTAIGSRYDDGTLTVTRADTLETLWEVEAPEGYRVHDGALSPDGEWVVLTDSSDRILVGPADGSTEPRVWVEDATTWRSPIWEGTPVAG